MFICTVKVAYICTNMYNAVDSLHIMFYEFYYYICPTGSNLINLTE